MMRHVIGAGATMLRAAQRPQCFYIVLQLSSHFGWSLANRLTLQLSG